MSCGCPSSCEPVCFTQSPNFGLDYPSLVGPMGPPGGPGTFVEDFDELRALDATVFTAGYQADVAGYANIGDGGGGMFYYSPAAVDADNDGTILAPTNGIGRWFRLFSGDVNPRWFGAKGDNATNDTVALQSTINYAVANGNAIKVPPGTYLHTGLTGLGSGLWLSGSGQLKTILLNTGAGASLVSTAGVRGLVIDGMQINGNVGSTDGVSLTDNFGAVRLINLIFNVKAKAVNIPGGNGIDLFMESVRMNAGTHGLSVTATTVVNQITLLNCYGNANTSQGFGFGGAGGVLECTMISCAADSGAVAYSLGSGNFTLIGCTAEANATNGFNVSGSGSFTFNNCATASQLLPFQVNAAGAHCVFLNPKSAGTPAGAALSIGLHGDLIINTAALLDAGLSGGALTAGQQFGIHGSTAEWRGDISQKNTAGGATGNCVIETSGSGSRIRDANGGNLTLKGYTVILDLGLGGLAALALPAVAPAAGSKGLWYDPAAANVVKFVP